MSFSNNLPPLAAGDQCKMIEMTPELKARVQKSANELVDWIQKHSPNPVEGYLVLQLVMGGISRAHKIKHVSLISEDDGATG